MDIDIVLIVGLTSSPAKFTSEFMLFQLLFSFLYRSYLDQLDLLYANFQPVNPFNSSLNKWHLSQ